MSKIKEYLKNIKYAIRGLDVRDSIYNAIKQCYEDATGNPESLANLVKELDVESARIDSLATLSEGSTTGDAELKDIRVGNDGINYSSAGNAVRAQVKDLTNADNLLFEKSNKLSERADAADEANKTLSEYLKAVSDKVDEMASEGYTLDDDELRNVVFEAVKTWMDENPDARATIEDASVTEKKISDETRVRMERVYRTIEEMKNDALLRDGMSMHSLGYYGANDGGNALYRVREKTAEDVEDGGMIHYLPNNLVAELVCDNVINIKQYGAKSGENCSELLNTIIANNDSATIVFPEGEYILNDVVLEGKRNFKFIGQGKAVVKTDMITTVTGAFVLKECEDIEFEGLHYTNNSLVSRDLYIGGLVMATNSTDIRVKGCHSKNTPYLVMLVSCKNSVINDNYAINEDDTSFGYSAILCKGCADISIIGNTILGYFGDGMLSYFGVSTRGIIKNNYLDCMVGATNYERQAITIDAETSMTVVKNNVVRNAYYGIDIKTLCGNISCYDNILYACKCGIAVRQGEISTGAYISNVMIRGNTIIMNDTNMIDDYKFRGLYSMVGINVEAFTLCNVSENTITMDKSTTATICDIMFAQMLSEEIPIAVEHLSSINGNILNLIRNEGRYLYISGDNSACIHLVNVRGCVISNNKCNIVESSGTRYFINNEKNSFNLNITDNLIKASSSDSTLALITGEEIRNSICKDNINRLSTYLNYPLGAVSGIVEDNQNIKSTKCISEILYGDAPSISLHVHYYDAIFIEITRFSAGVAYKSTVYITIGTTTVTYSNISNDREEDDLTFETSMEDNYLTVSFKSEIKVTNKYTLCKVTIK